MKIGGWMDKAGSRILTYLDNLSFVYSIIKVQELEGGGVRICLIYIYYFIAPCLFAMRTVIVFLNPLV